MWATRAIDDDARRVLVRRIALPPLVGLAVAWGVGRATGATLYELDFVTGWPLLALLSALAWWRTRPSSAARGPAAPLHAVGCAALVALFACHVRLTLPMGVVQIALFAGFVLYVAGWGVGVALATVPGESGRHSGWLRLHACSTSALLTLGAFHGVFSQAHGLLAHVFKE